MRTSIFFLCFLFSISIFGQFGTESNKYYEPFLYSRNSDGFVHSIDSIYYGKFDKFFVLKKSEDKDITKAVVFTIDPGYTPAKYYLNIDYYSKNKIKQFLLYSGSNGDPIDTFKYVRYDENGLLLIEQYKWLLDCATGNPNTGKRIIYSYNQNQKLVEKSVQYRWSNCAQSELSGIWIDHLKYEYVYDDKDRWIEYFRYSNLWKEGYDSIKLELFPLRHTKRIYTADRLEEEYKEVWNYDEETVAVTKYFDDYEYKGDSVFVVNNIWNADLSKWDKKELYKKYLHEGKTDVITEFWKGSYWEKYSYEYYTYSGFGDYFDYYHKTWDHTGWWLAHYDKYTGNANGVRKESYTDHGGGKQVTIFKYNSDHKLVSKTKFIYWGSSVTKLYELHNYYNSFSNIDREHEIWYNISSGEKTKETKNKYFWHSEKENFEYYLPLVDKDNEWNIGYRSEMGDTLSYVKNFGFSTYDLSGNGKKYKELLLLNPDSGVSPHRTERYYIEENGKIWRYRDEGDLLLFDFTLEKGDTFEVNDDVKLIVDTTFYKTMENGVERKVLQLFCYGEEESIKTTWIEGIGDLVGGIDNNASSCLTGYDRSLVCFHQDGELVYRSQEFDYCWPTATDEIVNNKLTIVPNPALDRINILTEDRLDNVSIFDISGKLVLESDNKNINITRLNHGLFIVKIRSGSKLSIGKFVKL